MPLGSRVTTLGITALLAACLLASCGNGPVSAQKKAVRDILRAIHRGGLTWACFSVGKAPTTLKVVQTVLSQTRSPHSVLHPGATVTLTMHHCPQ